MKKNSFIVFSLLALQLNLLGQDPFKHFPKGTSPQEVGLKLSNRFVISPHGVYGGKTKLHIPYFEVCTWYGALSFARLTKNDTLQERLIERFDPLWDKDSTLLPYPDHVDYNVFGTIPLELYLQTNEKRYLDMGRMYADTQWAKPFGPRVTEASNTYYNTGYSWQTRLWIDDMYMITMLQSQAYRSTHDEKYLNYIYHFSYWLLRYRPK